MIRTISKSPWMIADNLSSSGSSPVVQRIVWSTTVFVLSLFFSASVFSQSFMSEVARDGFMLRKVVSDLSICSGDYFSYTIYYSCPAGTTSMMIMDNLPPTLEFVNFLPPPIGACGPAAISTPLAGTMGGTVSLTWGAIPAGCSGSFSIVVRFPPGITCDGTRAENMVCLFGKVEDLPVQLCTEPVTTIAKAHNPWHIKKQALDVVYQGSSGACPYASGDTRIKYSICVIKDVGTSCQLNLENAVVTDPMPPGATLVPGSGCVTQTAPGAPLIWNIGSLSATIPFSTACCTFEVDYPSASYPTGTCMTNQARLTGTLGDSKNPCGTLDMLSEETSVEHREFESAWISKGVTTTGRPGCAGQYYIRVCNNGTLPITSFTVTDPLPAGLGSYSIGSISGMALVTWSPTATFTSTATLNSGDCAWVVIDFVIPPTATPGTVIENCATVTFGSESHTSCTSFMIYAPNPQPCLWKEVCNQQTAYTPGSVFRYRLRVQNIGGLPITGATITDVLNPNLTYLGAPSFYSSVVWNTPCQTTSTWSGSIAVSTAGGVDTLKISLPTIPALDCSNLFYTYCGMYGTGGAPFYFIEFDVKVKDVAALGRIPNTFTIKGGNLISPVTSDPNYVLIWATEGFNLTKSVATSPTPTTWSSSITTSPGATVYYRLGFTLATGSTAAIRNVAMTDLLPRDDSPNDRYILGPCSFARSPLPSFNISYLSTVSTSPTVGSGYPLHDLTSMAAPFSPLSGMFISPCGTGLPWNPTAAYPDRNIAYYFGAAALTSATVIFKAEIDPAAQNKAIACNTFAANGTVRHLIDATTIHNVPVGQLESGKACVTIKDPPTLCFTMTLGSITPAGTDAAGNCIYTVVLNITNPNSYSVLGWFSSPQGTVTPAVVSVLPATNPYTFTFTDTPPSDLIACIYGGLLTNAERIPCDTVCFDVPPCNQQQDNCCLNFIHTVQTISKYSNSSGVVWLSKNIVAGPLLIQRFSATIVSAQRRRWCYNMPAGGWERIYGDITAGFLGAPPAPGPQLLSTYSREAVWGPGQCVDWNAPGTILNLRMVFPPPYCTPCRDTLIFAIRYSFTDCECHTCDIVVYDTIARSCPGPWGGYDEAGVLGLVQKDDPTPGPGYEVGYNNNCPVCPHLNASAEAINNEGVDNGGMDNEGVDAEGTGDVMGEEQDLVFTNVRTYALYFTNTNSNKKTIYSLQLHPEPGMQILAVGPSSKKGAIAMLAPEKAEDGTYTIKTMLSRGRGVPANERVTPIFITVAGVTNSNANFGFTSFDAENNPVSTGAFRLANGVSSVDNIGGSSTSLLHLTAQPNPTTNSTTLSFSLERSTTNATLGIYNEQGQEVMNVLNNTLMERGNHVMTTDVSSLASGVYYVVLRTPLGAVSQPMTIVR